MNKQRWQTDDLSKPSSSKKAVMLLKKYFLKDLSHFGLLFQLFSIF